MSRTLLLLILAWPAIFTSAAACSREQESGPIAPRDTVSEIHPQVEDSSEHAYLALGDSYTVGTSIPPSGAYPLQTVQQLKAQGIRFSDPVIVAANGWTTTNLLAALESAKPAPHYDIVTMLIGVNNQYQGGSLDNYREQFTMLLKQAIQYADNRPGHVIVLSIPDYGVTPFAGDRSRADIAADIDAFNKVNKEIALAAGTQYLNITDETRIAGRNTSMLAPDGLHYAAAEYTVWAKALAALFRGALGQ